MKIQRAHKIRLYPNDKQANYFVRACGVSRFAYNWGLAEWRRQYESGGSPTPYLLKKKFISIKKDIFPFVAEVTKCAPEQALNDLGNAFKVFFKNVKKGRYPGYPRFKRKGVRDSFYIANSEISLKANRVRIPKLGWVRMRESLRFEGKILSVTVSRTAGMWFISVNVEQEIFDPVATGPVIGVDVGVKSLAVTSDGEVFENPKVFKKFQPRIRILQKAVSRKKKGSNNRRKALLRLQRQHHRVSNIRKDSLHKLTSAITKGVSVVGVEDLCVKGMLKNRKLSKAMSDASLSELLRQLEYKAAWRGVTVVKADRFYPSSKTCSRCGEVKAVLTLDDRIYKCDRCGLSMDRDVNAATNLMKMAVGSTVAACCLGSSGLDTDLSETTDWAGISHKPLSWVL